MKFSKLIALFSITISIFISSCGMGQSDEATNTTLSATEFSAKISELPNSVIVDVRTPDEFNKGHLQNAQNYDWNGTQFENQISNLDKSQPVLVYCLSGGRSSAAASKMREMGFQKVYEMDGGIMKWRAANLPETTSDKPVAEGMSMKQFKILTKSDKLVLVDFYADWCAPCKKMKPYLDEIASEMATDVTVIRINVDENQELCKALKIESLPVLQLYKAGKIKWENLGFIPKEDVVKQLK